MTLQPTGQALALLLLSAILLAFSWIVVAMRMWVRVGIRNVGLDDYLMLAGLLIFTATCQATITGSLNGVGSPPSMITDYYDRQGRMWFMFFQLFYVASTVPIKASICVAMLRITSQSIFRWILYTIIALTTIAALASDITVLTWCKPISATWIRGQGQCADASVLTSISYYISATSILTDWTCAIVPAIILWDVQLKWKIKASVAVVLGFGFIASAATIMRLRWLLAYSEPDAYLESIAHIAFWSILESGLGIIAGSLATLRPLLRSLPFFGSMHPSSGRARPKQPGVRQSLTLQGFGFGGATHQTICEGGDDWETLSDTESQRRMVDRGADGGKHGITVTTAIRQDTDA